MSVIPPLFNGFKVLSSASDKIFENAINKLIDHLEKCRLFCDFHFVFRSSGSNALNYFLWLLLGLGLLVL